MNDKKKHYMKYGGDIYFESGEVEEDNVDNDDDDDDDNDSELQICPEGL